MHELSPHDVRTCYEHVSSLGGIDCTLVQSISDTYKILSPKFTEKILSSKDRFKKHNNSTDWPASSFKVTMHS